MYTQYLTPAKVYAVDANRQGTKIILAGDHGFLTLTHSSNGKLEKARNANDRSKPFYLFIVHRVYCCKMLRDESLIYHENVTNNLILCDKEKHMRKTWKGKAEITGT